jgi:DNA invertase Pin-like site-specific DNA recombinase
MLRAAIYARKSTEQSSVGDDQKSVARQIEHARAFAVAKGWAVLDEHVYIDDGISGAEFDNRPGFMRLMAALRPRPACASGSTWKTESARSTPSPTRGC